LTFELRVALYLVFRVHISIEQLSNAERTMGQMSGLQGHGIHNLVVSNYLNGAVPLPRIHISQTLLELVLDFWALLKSRRDAVTRRGGDAVTPIIFLSP